MAWQVELNNILVKHSSTRADGRVASERTQSMTREVVFAAFRRLHKLNHKIENPRNLGNRHIQILVTDWYLNGKMPKTIQNELSRLRQFTGWIGKPGMVRDIEHYLPNIEPQLLKVSSIAQESKSWTENGIDILEIFKKVDQRDFRLGLMLRLELAFGLRREEVLKCNPHLQDYGHHLKILPGQGKGGRWRDIPISTPEQRQVLDFVKQNSSKTGYLGWEYARSGKPASLEQNIRKYENFMASLGLTKKLAGVSGHGLRAQFAENQALSMELIPSTLNFENGE